MKISNEREQYYKSQIKRILIRDPDLPVIGIISVLANMNIKLDKDYIYKLCKEIDIERTEQTDKILLKQMLIHYLERIKETDRYLWHILTSKEATNAEKISAIRTLNNNFKGMIDVMLYSGVFEKKVGAVKYDINEVFAAVKEIEDREKLQK